MRLVVAVLFFAGCGGKTDPHEPVGSAALGGPAVPVAPAVARTDASGSNAAAVASAASAAASAASAAAIGPAADVPQYDTLAAALAATIPADARVIGFGELHQRTDRAQIRPTLARFTEDALPGLADRMSDLVLETWIIDPGCGKAATEASAKVATTMRRPVQTQTDIGDLANAARAAKIQPHAMRVTCADYARIAPPGKPVDTPAMLDLTTRELGRIATEAVLHRDQEPAPASGVKRPWIALYGGALHNDRFPAKGVEMWSYAAKVDDVTHGHYVEIDLVAPELAEPEQALHDQHWYPVVEHANGKYQVWKRGERSFVIVLAKSPSAPASPPAPPPRAPASPPAPAPRAPAGSGSP